MLSLGIGNGGGKQGRGNQPPYRRYGSDTEIQYRPWEATRTCKTQQNSLQKGSRYGISVSTPHRVNTDTIADAVFPWSHKPMSLNGCLGNSEIGGPTLCQTFANLSPTFSCLPIFHIEYHSRAQVDTEWVGGRGSNSFRTSTLAQGS